MPKLQALAATVCCVANLAIASHASAAEWSSLDEAVAAWAAPNEKPDEYRVAMYDLNGDSIPDAIVFVTDRSYCGSGGCRVLVFKGNRHGFAFVSESTISREPIYVLPETTHGWHSLVVTAYGGGLPMKHALMRFDGKEYPLNPSLQLPVKPSDLSSIEPLKLQSPQQ